MNAQSAATMDPVIATGRGGSGTRLLSSLLQQLGVFLGNRLNASEDSVEWVDLIYQMAISASGSTACNEGSQWTGALRERASAILQGGQWQPGTQWGWKLPESMLVIPELAQSLPQARFIHLVRDPLDTCLRRTHMTSRVDNPIGRATLGAAYKELGWQQDPAADPDHIRNAASWRFQVGTMQQSAGCLGKRCLQVRYEDICSNRQAVADRIAQFLGLAPVAVILAVDADRRRRWANDDPRADEVWNICGPLATLHGYCAPDCHSAPSAI